MDEIVFKVITLVTKISVKTANTPTRVRHVHLTMVAMLILGSNWFNFIERVAVSNPTTEDVAPPRAMQWIVPSLSEG